MNNSFTPESTINQRHTPDGHLEDKFRLKVRDALDLDIFARDDQIIEKIREVMAFRREALDR